MVAMILRIRFMDYPLARLRLVVQGISSVGAIVGALYQRYALTK